MWPVAGVLLAILLGATLVSNAAADCISLRPGAAWMERAAAGDLQRVVLAATGTLIPVRPALPSDRCVFAVGHKGGCKVELSLRSLGDQGFVLKTVRSGSKTTVVAAGATPQATTYAVYALAEQYGAGFYLGGDALPRETKPFYVPDLDVISKPAIQVRGVLPWYNFFNSPTAWNIEDYRFFIDQLAKSRNNFLGFHSYDYEPFCAYRNREGKLTAGAPLNNTSQPTWGSVSMKTSEFAFGTGAYFAKDYFGADCSMGYKTPDEGILSAQRLLAEAFRYAKARGVRTCIGFEATGDPTDPGDLDEFELRIKHVLRAYPTVDYVWIWETEGKGVRGWNAPRPRTDFGAYCRRWQEQFRYIPDLKRRTEAVRLGIYSLAAHRILEREAPHVKMVLSGWGGDKHLHVTDFYIGLDKILPRDIIFAALDNIVTSDTVSAAYAKLSKGREFWPIPWFERDGDMWFPQPNTKIFSSAARDSLAKGAKGLLGIHWRSRDVEESHAYISQFAWDPDLGYEEFYRSYAARRFGDERAAGLLMGLQDLGYRWLGGGGQAEYMAFGWGPAPAGAAKRLEDVFSRFDGSLLGTESLDDLIRTEQWAVGFDKAAWLLHGGGEIRALLNKLKVEGRSPTDDEKALLRDRVAGAEDALRDAMQAFARKISTRGELGVLATVNAKAWADLLVVKKAVALACGEIDAKSAPTSAAGVDAPLAVSSILRLTTAFAGKPFRISALVHSAPSGAVAKAVYRSANGDFHSSPLKFVNRGRLEGGIPAAAVKAGVLEYYIQVTAGPESATWPIGAPSAVERIAVVSEPGTSPTVAKRSAAAHATPTPLGIKITTGPMLVQIEWPGSGSARRFRVLRQVEGQTDWSELARTRDTWFEDRSVEALAVCRYRILDDDTGATLAQSGPVAVPEPPAAAAPEIRATPIPEGVRMIVSGADLVAGCAVYRAESENGPFARVEPTSVSPVVDGVCACTIPAEPSKTYYYQARVLSSLGGEGAASKPIAVTALCSSPPPTILQLNFDGTDEAQVLDRTVVDGTPALDAREGKYLRLPNSPVYNTGNEVTVEFRVKLLSPGVTPTFVCHGARVCDGFYVQQEDGQLNFAITGVGSLRAGSIPLGKWTHVVATYDGTTMTTYIDGKKVGSQPAWGSITPSPRPLYIARYEVNEKTYEFDGYIAGVRLYAYALSQSDVEGRYKQPR